MKNDDNNIENEEIERSNDTIKHCWLNINIFFYIIIT